MAHRGVREVDREAVDEVTVEPAVADEPPEAASAQLRVGEVVEVVLHGRGGHARGLQHERRLLARAAGAPLREGGFELLLVRAAALEGLEAGIVGPLGASDRARERAPLLVVAGGDGDPAVVVDGGEDAARRRAGAAVAAAVRLLAAERDLPDVRPEAGDGGLELRDVDPLPGAAAFAVQQRADDRRHRVVARDVVGQWHGRHRRLAVGVARQVVEAGERGEVGAPRLVVAVRALAAAVARHAHVDDVRVHRAHVLVVDPQRVDRRHAEVRQEHVALLDEAVEELTPLGRLELEADAALLRVERVVPGEHVAACEAHVRRRPCGRARAHRGAARA